MREEQTANQPPRIDVEMREDEIVLTAGPDGPDGSPSVTLPRNSLTVFLAQVIAFALVVTQINRSLKRICLGVIGVIDAGFEKLYDASVRTRKFITSEKASYLLTNIKKILVIILIGLAILDVLNVVDYTVPTWIFSL